MNILLTRGIYLRGNVYWFRLQKDKKRHFISLSTPDLAEAIRKVARLRHSLVLQSGDVIKYSVDRFISYMRERGEWTRSTKDSKGYVIKQFAEYCGNVLPADVTTDLIKKYHAKRTKSCSVTTAYGNIMTVRSYFNWCLEVEKSVRENPCANLRLRAPATVGRRDFCPPELVAKLINECERDDLRFVLHCGFYAGLRAIEIVEARPFWFDLKAGLLHLRKTPTIEFKDGEERTIPMTGKFLTFIRDEYGLREPFMLHPEKAHAKNRYRYDFTRPFQEYMREKNCAWVTPHIMRHTFASLLASANVSIFKIATYLGDGVRVVQKHYAKLLPETGALDAAFHSPKPFQASRPASSSTRS